MSDNLGQKLKEVGRHMPRTRHQEGWVEETGKKVKKWKGHFFVYRQLPDGGEKRGHRAVILGVKAKMKKWDAEQRLRGIIDKETAGAQPSPAYTLRWFWEQRYRPMKEGGWKASSRPKTIRFVEHYVLDAALPSQAKLGDVPLGDLDRFTIQMVLNDLGKRFSKSVVQKFQVYLHSILDEALEQGFIGKNPARKLTLPEVVRKPSKRVLSEEEIIELLGVLSGRDRLIIRMFLILALRPGELFALRRNDRIYPSQLRIDESVSEELKGGERIVAPKTEASAAYVWLPKSIETELDWWFENQQDKRAEAFVFPSTLGTPLNLNNFLNRVIKPAAASARKKITEDNRQAPAGFLEGINHQVFRRTCATQMQAVGSVKDVQFHLRHATPAMTIGTYMQAIPASVRAAVEALDQKLSAPALKAASGGVQ